ncbi:MAG: hypothetical protein AB7E81_20510 [Hyphomicrobiaceae bacterium]
MSNSDAELMTRIRKLAATAWPNWWRAAGSRLPPPRVFPFESVDRPEIDAIKSLMSRRTVAYGKKRGAECELLEIRAREKMVELVKNKPAGVERALAWIEDVALAADLLHERKTAYASTLNKGHAHSVVTLADTLFAHALPWLAERENADHPALARRMNDCKSAIKLAAQNGPLSCPMGKHRDWSRSYETQMRANRSAWYAKRGRQREGAGYGPRPGSIGEARVQIREEANRIPEHLMRLHAKAE